MRWRILAAIAALVAALQVAAAPPRVPAFLKPGDKIAIISPASAIRQSVVDGAAQVLASWGYRPVMGRGLGSYYHGFAGTIDERKNDLLDALQDTTIKAIMCAEGGYGSMQLLSEIPLRIFTYNPKWIIGYSDITALHSAQVRGGGMSIHASMCSRLNKTGGTDSASTVLRNLLGGKLPTYRVAGSSLNTPGRARGVLVGGNLSVMCAMVGNGYDFLDPAFLRGKDYILFFEDVHESYAHVDRMLHSLKLRGVLKNAKGIIIGKFKDYNARADGYDGMDDMLFGYLKDLRIPVCYGFPTSHYAESNFPLIEGCPVTLDVRADSVTLSFQLPNSVPPRH